jgi:hypothetical protein
MERDAEFVGLGVEVKREVVRPGAVGREVLRVLAEIDRAATARVQARQAVIGAQTIAVAEQRSDVLATSCTAHVLYAPALEATTLTVSLRTTAPD